MSHEWYVWGYYVSGQPCLSGGLAVFRGFRVLSFLLVVGRERRNGKETENTVFRFKLEQLVGRYKWKKMEILWVLPPLSNSWIIIIIITTIAWSYIALMGPLIWTLTGQGQYPRNTL